MTFGGSRVHNGHMANLVRIHVAGSAVEGHLAQSRLEAEGIPVFTNGEGDGPYRMGPLNLWVHPDHEVQARLVMAEVLGGSLALPAEEDAPSPHEAEPAREE